MPARTQVRCLVGLIHAWLAQRVGSIAAVFFVSAVTYSYLISSIIFTNHTIPNAQYWSYPSYRTTLEGRWFADVLVLAAGGHGNQAFQTVGALLILALCGLLLAELFDVRGRFQAVLIALIVSLNPLLLDYHAFAIDQIGFALGDLLAVAGVLILARVSDRRIAIPLAASCFVLTLATYQSKIGIIGVLLLCWLASRRATSFQDLFWKSVVPGVVSGLAASLTYWLSARLTATLPERPQSNLDPLPLMLKNAASAYPRFTADIIGLLDPLVLPAQLGAAFLLISALAVLVIRARNHLPLLLVAVACTVLIPLAVRATYVLNSQAPEGVARLSVGYVYLAASAAAIALATQRRSAATAAALVLVYGFVLLGSQESSFIAMKSLVDTRRMADIASRVSVHVPDGDRRGLVVIGRQNLELAAKFLKDPNRRFAPHMHTDPFKPYRQVQIVNFLLGKDAFVAPSAEQVALGLAVSKEHQVWPSQDAVFEVAGAVVVVLQHGSTETTWSR